MRRQINNLISVGYSAIRMGIYKLINGSSFQYSVIERFSPNVVMECNLGSKVTLGKMVRVHSGSKIKVRSGAELYIGDNVKINYNCIIVCHDWISIGNGTEFGPSVYVYDHDHDFRVGMKEEKFQKSPVIIGENCWIGANTVILRGSKIGNNCVIGAGCIVTKTVPDNTILVQKRKNIINTIIRTDQ